MPRTIPEQTKKTIQDFIRTIPIAFKEKTLCHFAVFARIDPYIDPLNKEETGCARDFYGPFKLCLREDKEPILKPIGAIPWRIICEQIYERHGKNEHLNRNKRYPDNRMADLFITGLRHGLAVTFMRHMQTDHLLTCMNQLHEADIQDPYDALHDIVGECLLNDLCA